LTVTVPSTVVPLRGPAVRVVVPGRRPVRGIGAVRLPAGTVTEAGRVMRPAGLLARATGVSVAWAAFRVRVRVVEAPTRSVVGLGVRPMSVGCGGWTWMVACLVVSLRGPAVMVAVPGVSPVIVTVFVRAPAGTGMLAGTVTTPTSLEVSGTTVSMGCVALRVTVHWPVAPTVSVAGQARALTAGGGGSTVTAEVALVPLRDAVTVAAPRARPAMVNVAERV
jgi:hypothetical protein